MAYNNNNKNKKKPNRKGHKSSYQSNAPKKDLIRVVRTPEKTVEIDLTGKKNGHGAYISKSLETLALAKKNKALQRALETEIPDEVYQELEAIITNE